MIHSPNDFKDFSSDFRKTHLSLTMYVAIILASVMNGPTEETYWRACMEDVGINAGVSEKRRIAFAPVAFALWHTAFLIHLFPWDQNWIFW
ncbi:MAG: CPBP family glutamic-type intramembrane protease [Candidatus Helarchaeota archaeon]